jgi:hypothetical protein
LFKIINKPKEKKEENLSEDEKWKRSVSKYLIILCMFLKTSLNQTLDGLTIRNSHMIVWNIV